jgi:hypothetical protein
MTRIVVAVLGVLAALGTADAQAQLTDAQLIQRALLAAPERAREGAAVVKWNADHTYVQIKEGTGTLVCYDHSGAAFEQPFSVQCTHPGNLPRVQQNYRLEAQAAGNRETLNQLLAAAEQNGTRVRPVYGSPWLSLTGADQASARLHMTIAVPGATSASTGGLPENGREGGAWIMNAGTSTAHLMIPGM